MNHNLVIRTYHPNHKDACMAIFDSNLPKYFTQEERGLFEQFLDEQATDGNYFVAVDEDTEEVKACGGYFHNEEKDRYGLSWGMVHQNYHRQGIGQAFTRYRIMALQKAYPDRCYMLETSQHTYTFYEKMGYKVVDIKENGFGEDLHSYYMELDFRSK